VDVRLMLQGIRSVTAPLVSWRSRRWRPWRTLQACPVYCSCMFWIRLLLDTTEVRKPEKREWISDVVRF